MSAAPHVVVVGGGLSGVMAAMRAHALGARVTLVRRAYGSTALSAGLLDVAAAPASDSADLAALEEVTDAGDTLSAQLFRLESHAPAAPTLLRCLGLLARRPHHPYRVVGRGLDQLPQALEALRAGCGDLALALPRFDRPNLALATEAGTVIEAGGAQGAIAAGDLRALRSEARVGVAEFVALPGFRAAGVAACLQSVAPAFGIPPTVRFEPLRVGYFRRHSDAYAGPHAAAGLLDDAEAFERIQRALTEACRGVALDAVLLPAVLGTTGAAARAQALSQAAGVRVAELVPVQESVPGRRLQSALNRWLEREKIPVVVADVDRPLRQGRRVKALELRPAVSAHAGGPSGWERRIMAPEELALDALVLATGRFLGGGVIAGALLEPAPLPGAPGWQHRRIRESICDLPIYDGDRSVDETDSLKMTAPDLSAPQPLFRLGVATDAALRPLDATGKVALENVWAAGRLLGGWDPAADHCAAGVDALTGWLAGQAAAGGVAALAGATSGADAR